VSDLKNEFAYSWSRSEAFYYCPRRFYWQHYGSWGGWELDAPKSTQLAYRLKQIKSVAMLIGDVFHEIVSQQLRERPERPCGVPLDTIRTLAEQRMHEHLTESRERRWRSNPKYNANLFEDYYGGGLAQREADEGLEALRKCVEGLAASGFGRRAFGVEKARLRIIDPQNFDQKRALLDGLIVYAPPDMLVEGKDGVSLHIIDWKTGRPRKASLPQLAIYGLVVSEQQRVPIGKLEAHLVYVGQGTHEQFPDLAAGMEEAKRSIETFVKDVRDRLTDVELNLAGDSERFPMTSDLWKCRSCKFRELCGRMGEAPLTPDGDPVHGALEE
jgi:hypothetical protein